MGTELSNMGERQMVDAHLWGIFMQTYEHALLIWSERDHIKLGDLDTSLDELIHRTMENAAMHHGGKHELIDDAHNCGELFGNLMDAYVKAYDWLT